MKKKRRRRLRIKGIKPLVVLCLTYTLYQQKEAWMSYAKNYTHAIFCVAAVLLIISLIKKTYKREKRRKEYLMYLSSDIKRVDKLSGIEFERYLCAHFKKKGYRVFLTPPQHDYGVDLVIKKGNDKIAVQAKRYNHEQGYKVTYKAVQEVAAGKAYYGCNKGIVITNSFFTKSARELAECNNIDLWDRKRMIEEFRAFNAPDISSYKTIKTSVAVLSQ